MLRLAERHSIGIRKIQLHIPGVFFVIVVGWQWWCYLWRGFHRSRRYGDVKRGLLYKAERTVPVLIVDYTYISSALLWKKRWIEGIPGDIDSCFTGTELGA